ncbi:MAG: diacylglycerol/lipid kinase family protein [Frankiaceae bacterium]
MPMSALPPRAPAAAERWLARGALAAAALALVVLVAAAGIRTIPLLLIVIAMLAVVIAGAWVFLAHRGAVRLLGAALAVVSIVAVLVLEVAQGLLWAGIVCGALLLASLAAAGAALRPAVAGSAGSGTRQPPPAHAFLIMNPRSGGGKVDRFGLRDKAKQLGAEVALLDGNGTTDVAELARSAIARGADLVGVAGGDGTQALVAGVAAEHDIPLLVIPAGTRNHFALDLGLDRDDPAKSLEALTDGVEIRVDLGDVGGRPFVNNVSFGAYADIVTRPDYRDDKRRVTLDVLPDVLSKHVDAGLTVRAGSTTVRDPQAALVSNNPYLTNDIVGLGRRARLDGGLLGLIAVRVASAREAAQLLRGRHASALTTATAEAVVVESAGGQLPAGIDGEIVMLTSPVECRVRVAALRVLIPRDRAARPPREEPLTLRALVRVAAPAGRRSRAATASVGAHRRRQAEGRDVVGADEGSVGSDR